MDMVAQLKKYMQDVRRNIEPYLLEKKPKPSIYRCCLSLTNKEIKLLVINHTQESVEISLSEILRYDDIESLSLVLSGLIRKHKLELAPTYWLLSPEDYSIFLIDSLAVEKDEYREAIQWRIRNLISYPIGEAVIDSFNFPPKKTGATHPMVAAVVSRKNQLNTVISTLKSANVNLTVIDIPELALRNLTAQLETDEKSTALMYFFEKYAILNITHQKTLYFTRRISLYLETEPKLKDYEQLSLDIVRYFDYFQTQWRLPSPTRICVASQNGDIPEITTMLSKHLMMPVEPFHLNFVLADSSKIKQIEKHYLLQLGCALRKESSNAETRN